MNTIISKLRNTMYINHEENFELQSYDEKDVALGIEQMVIAFMSGFTYVLYKQYQKLLRKIESINVKDEEFNLQSEDEKYHRRSNFNRQNKIKNKIKIRKSIQENKKEIHNSNKIRIKSAIKEAKLELQSTDIIKAIAGDPIVRDWGVKLLEDTAVLMRLLSTGKSKTDYIFAITTFAKLRSPGPLISSDLTDRLLTFFDNIFSNELELQSVDEIFSSARGYLNKYDEVKQAPIFKKMYKFLMYSMSLSLFDKVGVSFNTLNYNKLEQEALRKKYAMGTDFIHTLLDTLLFLCERGYQAMVTGDIDKIFHSGKSYDEWAEKVRGIVSRSTLLNEPEYHGFTEHSFLEELDDLIEKGENIHKHASKMGDYEKSYVRRTVNDLLSIKYDICTKKRARQSRDIPFSVLLYSAPKVGKTTAMDILRLHYAKYKGKSQASDAVYTRNAAADRWDGFTTSQWCLILDDVAFMNPNSASAGDPSCLEFLQIVNGVAFTPEQAELQDKGRIPFRGELVIATTNTEDLNCYYYFSCPSAAQRRFPFIIIPKVKVEYADENGGLDSSKVPEVTSGYPDFWTWTVKKVLPATIETLKRNAKMEILFEDADLPHFLNWYNSAIEDHDRVTKQMNSTKKVMRDVELCRLCKLPTSMCRCTQSLDEVTYHFVKAFVLSHCLSYFAALLYLFYTRFSVVRSCHTYFQKYMWIKRTMNYIEEVTHNYFTRYFEKHFWLDLGEKVKNKITYPKFLTAVVAGIMGGILLRRIFSFIYEVQGSNTSTDVGVKPEPSKEERDSVWYKNEYELSSFDLTPKITSSKSLGIDYLTQLIAQNSVAIKFNVDEGVTRRVKGLCVCGQIYVMTNHSVPNKDILEGTVVQQTSKDGVTTNMDFTLTSNQILRFPEKDIVFIVLNNLPPKKNITDFFPKNTMEARMNGRYIKRDENGEVVTLDVTHLHKSKNFRIPPLDLSADVWKGTVRTPTKNGDCGSMLIAETELGPCILGPHVLGYDDMIVAHCLTQCTVKNALISLSNFSIQSGEPELSSKSAPRNLCDLHKKATVRYVGQGTAAVYGSFKDFRGKPKSRVCASPLAPFLSPDYKIKYGKPVMDTWEPWRIALLDMVDPVTQLQQNILDECTKSFTTDILQGLDKEALSRIEIYDDFTALNGAAGISYVDKINRNTSAGNPWKKSKKFFLRSLPPEHNLQDPVEANEEIMDRVKSMIIKYKNGSTNLPNFCAHLKDEPVSFAKVKAKKTRVFTGAPFDWSIVVRKYLLSFIRVLQGNRYTFEAAPGTICQSLEWHEMYNYLTAHGGNRLIAGDYKAFDKKMPPQIILAAFTIIQNVCEASGNYDAEDLRVIRGIAMDTAFPLVDFNGDLIQFFGSNPSGHPLTVIINSLVNSLYMRYCYYILNPDKEINTFKKNVNLITYGDDNAMGVSKNIQWFNHTSIQSALASINIVYTMADKEAKSVPFISINETSFLKRTWRYDVDVDAFLCPLEHDSIEKMLMVWTRSKTITAEEQAIAVIASAIREYFYYGKSIFEEKTTLLKKVVKEAKLEPWVEESTFPSWTQLKVDFWRNSEHVNI